MFLFGTRLKPSGVFDEDHGNVVKVTEANKAGVLIGRLDIDLSGGHRRVVGDKSNHLSAHATQRTQGVFRAIGLDLQIVPVVAQLLNQNANFQWRVKTVRSVKRLFKQNVGFPGFSIQRITGPLDGRHFGVVAGQIAQNSADFADGSHFVFNDEIGHAGVCMHFGSAQLVCGHVFTQNRFDNARSSQTEEGVARLNNKAALARQV